MKVQLIVSRKDERFFIDIEERETVFSLRQRVAEMLGLNKNNFILISFGKILNDKCSDQSMALLSSTYRIRDKTSIFVHITDDKPKAEEKTVVSNEAKGKKKTVLSLDVVTKPFEEFFCSTCKNKSKKCIDCGCKQCSLKTGDPIICDQCDNYWHAQCAGLKEIPEDEYWYCPDCINPDVDLIVDKEKTIQNTTSLDSLVKMREEECSIVPRNHVGKIPGVYCGQTWENLNACSNWGVHRTTSLSNRVMGGVDLGAVSIFLYRNRRNFKTYEDKGYKFIIFGLGVITRFQPENRGAPANLMDKTLVRQDLALALTCDAPLNCKMGAKANDWRNSRPVRVCRSNSDDHSQAEFAPEKGVRYDGLYKVVKYWPEICENPKRVVWKFQLRRDDDELAPWLEQSKKLSIQRGLRMIYEDGDRNKKLVLYKIPQHIVQLMDKDIKNKRKWDEIKKREFWSEYEFVNYIFDHTVACCSSACSKPIQDPIVSPCGHIFCKKCLKHSKMDTCFTCRTPFNNNMMIPDEQLVRILKAVSPTYGEDTEKVMCPAKSYELLRRNDGESLDNNMRKRIRIVIDDDI